MEQIKNLDERLHENGNGHLAEPLPPMVLFAISRKTAHLEHEEFMEKARSSIAQMKAKK